MVVSTVQYKAAKIHKLDPGWSSVVSNVLSTVSLRKGSGILQDRKFCTNLHWSGRHGKENVLV